MTGAPVPTEVKQEGNTIKEEDIKEEVKPTVDDLKNSPPELKSEKGLGQETKEEIKEEQDDIKAENDEIKEETVTPPETPAANGISEPPKAEDDTIAEGARKEAEQESNPPATTNGQEPEPMETEDSAPPTNGTPLPSSETTAQDLATADSEANNGPQQPASPENQAVDLTPDALAMTGPPSLTATAPTAPPEEEAAHSQPPPAEPQQPQPQPQQQHIYIQAIDPKTNLPIQVRLRTR